MGSEIDAAAGFGASVPSSGIPLITDVASRYCACLLTRENKMCRYDCLQRNGKVMVSVVPNVTAETLIGLTVKTVRRVNLPKES